MGTGLAISSTGRTTTKVYTLVMRDAGSTPASPTETAQ